MDIKKGKVLLNTKSINEEVSKEDSEIEKGAFFIKSPTMLDPNQKKLYKMLSDNFTNPADVLQTVFVWVKDNNPDPDNAKSWKVFIKDLGLNLVKVLTKSNFIVGK